MWRTLRTPLTFFAIGTTGTAAYAGLFWIISGALPAPVALGLAWLVSTLATNLAHREITFRVRGDGRWVDALVFFVTSLFGLALTQVFVAAGASLGRGWHLAAIVTGTAIGGVARFLVMRWWVRGPRSVGVIDKGARPVP